MANPAVSLPIDDTLDEILATLGASNRLILAAPPGAGKTTRVPLALLNTPWCTDKIIILEPRRIAARMAAERMAASLNEPLGKTIGLSTRIDRKLSKETRVEVVTDGVFTRRILNDPSLDGVSAVVFDEIHERSLSADLGLAFALETQDALREDLRLVLMSATLDTKKLASVLTSPVIESQGRSFPVTTKYLGRTTDPISEQAARAIHRALNDEAGSLLVFLPGAADIRRTEGALSDLPHNVSVHPLFGALSPAEQQAAIAPPSAGHRKIVLATDLAESSLTIEGIRVVIDCGLARMPVLDPSGLSTRLQTVRASRASVDQRRGRAGRTEPGMCYRLWDEAETRGLPLSPDPEILISDLTGLRLSLAEWGAQEASSLTWLDPPAPGRLRAAEKLLSELGAFSSDMQLTDKGKAMAALPLEPRLAALIASSDTPSERALASQIAVLISERGIGGNSTDLSVRLDNFQRDKSPRATALKRNAERWSDRAKPGGDASRILAKAWPGQIAKARSGKRGEFLLASGQAGRIDPTDTLAQSEWLVVVSLIGTGTPRISSAIPISEQTALRLGRIEEVETAEFDARTKTVKARFIKRMGAIVLSESPREKPSGDVARQAILNAVRAEGFETLGLSSILSETVARIQFLRQKESEGWPDWSVEDLLRSVGEWLAPLIGGAGGLIPSEGLVRDGLLAQLEWPQQQTLSEAAPLSITLPSSRKAKVVWSEAHPPMIEARPQELYGLTSHPMFGDGNANVLISLLSPAKRQIALTQDLPGFWNGGYKDMAKDMRAKYPKHDWPNDPSTAKPHQGLTKARLKHDAQ